MVELMRGKKLLPVLDVLWYNMGTIIILDEMSEQMLEALYSKSGGTLCMAACTLGGQFVHVHA